MTRMIFVNLPVADLPRSIAFYEVIGFRREPAFSNDQAAMMVLSDTISFMLLTHDFFRSFTPKPIPDAHAGNEVLLCVSCENRAAVDAMTEAAATAGGRIDIAPRDDNDFMYGRNFEDLDGHVLAPMWMDAEAAQAAMTAAAA